MPCTCAILSSVTWVCVFVALGTQHAMHMRHLVICHLSVCVCSLRHPACHAHAPSCHLSPAPPYNIFPHNLINSTFYKKVTEPKLCVYWSIFVRNISHSKKKWARYDKKMYIGLHVKYHLSCLIFIKLAFSRRIVKKYSNVKFYENCPVGAELFHADGRTDRQTDRQTDVTKVIVTFHSFVHTPKK